MKRKIQKQVSDTIFYEVEQKQILNEKTNFIKTAVQLTHYQ